MSTDGGEEPPVVVAGAGPVGMTAALALHARGVPVTVLEADPEDRERPGSRAIYVHGSTLRTLERNHPGLGRKLADEGMIWPTRRTLWRGKEVFSRTYSNPGGSGEFPHFTSLPQVWTEDFMLEALGEAGVDVRWDTPVETVDPSPDGVLIGTGDGGTWEAQYLVGADGAGSTVREEIGAEFEGDRSANSFIIADVEEHPDPRDKERVFHYDHPGVDGRNVLLVPFQGGWRVDIQCEESDDPDHLASDGVIDDLIATTLGERYRDRVTWVSTYRFLQVTADSFTDDDHRRVLLAGEAAHLFAPFGARGMNSGIVDAEEAASAIAVALRATVDEVARNEVAKYAARRERAAEWNKDAAGQALEHLQGEGIATRAKKRIAAELADYWERAGEWLDDAPYGPHGSPPTSVGRY